MRLELRRRAPEALAFCLLLYGEHELRTVFGENYGKQSCVGQ